MNLLIIGHARHGKDTAAEYIRMSYGLTYESSSMAACDIFIFDMLKDKYGYHTPEQCFEDRVNHRAEWHDLIVEYNKHDPARLAKDIMAESDMYIGMRSAREIQECRRIGLFDYVIGIYDPRKPEEPKESFDMNLFKESDVVIPNSGSIQLLHMRLDKFFKPVVELKQFSKMLKSLTDVY